MLIFSYVNMLMSVWLMLPLVGLPPLSLSSPAIDSAGRLAPDFTCAGKGETPPLQWGPPPPLTRSLALVIDDPDAPSKAYWTVHNLPPDARGLSRRAAQRNDLPPPALASVYEPPCATSPRQRVRVRLFAVDQALPNRRLEYAELEQLLVGHLLAFGELDASNALDGKRKP
jgi:phosphatidylethanolamine-binding protein (PEBP) family uncharacterized protein